MLYLLDLAGDIYSSVMAVVNYICFTAFCACCVIIYVAGAIGQFHSYYKSMAIGSFLTVVVLLVAHFSLQNFGITILVPPIGTPYFTEFMHVIQYLVTIAVVILVIVIFATALLSRLDRYYTSALRSAVIFLIVLICLHYYIYDNFGISLIFPPNLW